MKNNFKKNRNGFTLIELMVSISIFMMIMLVAMSSLFVALDASKRARALRYAMDNVNFAMDSMSRSLRMGTNYSCGHSKNNLNEGFEKSGCPSGGENKIAFISQDGNTIYYGIKTGSNGNGIIERCNESSVCADMTSSDVDIKQLEFEVDNINIQPRVAIYLKGVVMMDNGKEVSFSIQTLASQRNFLD